jgi:hypothetical protein
MSPPKGKEHNILRADSDGVPSPKSQVTGGQLVQSQSLRARGPKYDMDAYMAPLSGGEVENLS